MWRSLMSKTLAHFLQPANPELSFDRRWSLMGISCGNAKEERCGSRGRCGESRRNEDSAAKEGRRVSWKSERISRGAHSVRIGVPKEIKDQEGRVGITPAGVQELVNAGHVVLVQKEGGEHHAICRGRLGRGNGHEGQGTAPRGISPAAASPNLVHLRSPGRGARAH